MEDCHKMKFCPKKNMHERRYDSAEFCEKVIENPYSTPKRKPSKQDKISKFTDYIRVPNENKDVFVILLLIALLLYILKA